MYEAHHVDFDGAFALAATAFFATPEKSFGQFYPPYGGGGFGGGGGGFGGGGYGGGNGRRRSEPRW